MAKAKQTIEETKAEPHHVTKGGVQVFIQAETPFEDILKKLKEPIAKVHIKQREGFKDKLGKQHYFDYVEWTTVASILDHCAPEWSHRIVKMAMMTDFLIVCQVELEIAGVVRQGIGTATMKDSGGQLAETAVKKAESDALKRAAVKFGVARHLYADEEVIFSSDDATTLPSQVATQTGRVQSKQPNPPAQPQTREPLPKMSDAKGTSVAPDNAHHAQLEQIVNRLVDLGLEVIPFLENRGFPDLASVDKVKASKIIAELNQFGKDIGYETEWEY